MKSHEYVFFSSPSLPQHTRMAVCALAPSRRPFLLLHPHPLSPANSLQKLPLVSWHSSPFPPQSHLPSRPPALPPPHSVWYVAPASPNCLIDDYRTINALRSVPSQGYRHARPHLGGRSHGGRVQGEARVARRGRWKGWGGVQIGFPAGPAGVGRLQGEGACCW